MSLAIEGCSVAIDGTVLLFDVCLTIRSGELLGVIGPNGAGKSTLCRAVTGLVPFAGAISALGVPQTGANKRQWARLVAYVPQRPILPASMTVTDYVLLGRSAHHSFLGAETRSDRRAVASVLDRLDLAGFAQRALSHVSGGEAQRVVLARALAQEAPVLVLDEPTASLDLGHSQMVLSLVDELRREEGLSVLCTMHDLTLAGQYSDRLLVLSDGRAVMSGAPGQVLTDTMVAEVYGAQAEVLRRPSGPGMLPLRVVAAVDIEATAARDLEVLR